jgi:CubicO group peptidase (beta-lactamase class C family)
VIKLRDQGKLNLDHSLTKYLPELAYNDVTLRHLLTHTSGVLEYQSSEIIETIAGKSVSNDELIRTFATLNPKLQFEPGTKWDYSNTNYIFLAAIVERVSRKPFPEFVRETIFLRPQVCVVRSSCSGMFPRHYSQRSPPVIGLRIRWRQDL